jgi:hypothetical protein
MSVRSLYGQQLKGCLTVKSRDKVGHDVDIVTSIFIIVIISISIGARELWNVFLSLFLFLQLLFLQKASYIL